MLGALRRAGVDIFHASTRRFYRPEWPGSELGLAGWTKSLTDAAVIAVGSSGLNIDVMDTVYTDKALSLDIEPTLDRLHTRFNNREFDLIAVGRSMIGDQEWVNKILARRYTDIRPFSRDILKEALNELDDSTIRAAHRES
jgi:2,4-dienoyl-CoA reductase-like NADH-dependent reductase (Old Yellow Enzyme family)